MEGNLEERDYIEYLERVIAGFRATTYNHQLYTTDATGLWELYLQNLPEADRQYHNCHACQDFIEHYGGLVIISNHGRPVSAVWSNDAAALSLKGYYMAATLALRMAVENATIIGPFYSIETVLGRPVTGIWTHLSVCTSRTTHDVNEVGRLTAEKREQHRILKNALNEFRAVLRPAATLLTNGGFYRAETAAAQVCWAADLVDRLLAASALTRDNLLWTALETMPAGFASLRGNSCGLVLDGLVAGRGQDQIRREFEAVMDPTHYRRAQVAPEVGNIVAAEKLVAERGLQLSFTRRHAGLDEVPCFWKSNVVERPANSFFADVAVKTPTSKTPVAAVAARTMTWIKFARDILPEVTALKLRPPVLDRAVALTTAVYPEAPCVLKWGHSFAWYYHAGTDAEMQRRVESRGGIYKDVELRCTLMWNSRDDLDLYADTEIVRRQRIYFGAKRDSYGGYLDVDANASCVNTIMDPVENIRWQTVPDGTFQFGVSLWKRYTNSNWNPISYQVEVAAGDQVQRVCSSFLGQTDAGRHVTSVFTVKRTRGVFTIEGYGTPVTAPPAGWLEVAGITTAPDQWNDQILNHIMFLVKDGTPPTTSDRGLFTEMLVSELQPVRATLENYLAQQTTALVENPAYGYGFKADRDWNLSLQATTRGGMLEFTIDRYE